MDRLTEKELRQIALTVHPYLPPDDNDCERVFEFARELRQWERKSGPDDEGNDEPVKQQPRKRRPKIHIVRTPKPFSAPVAALKPYRSYVWRG